VCVCPVDKCNCNNATERLGGDKDIEDKGERDGGRGKRRMVLTMLESRCSLASLRRWLPTHSSLFRTSHPSNVLTPQSPSSPYLPSTESTLPCLHFNTWIFPVCHLLKPILTASMLFWDLHCRVSQNDVVKEQVERLQRASVHIQEKTSKLVDQVKDQVGSGVGAVMRESHAQALET
jgi:hypothetical protein